MKLSCFSISITLLFLHCRATEEIKPTLEVMPTPTQKDSLTYLALGDSYTIGQGVLEVERYPNQLAAVLSKKGILVKKPKIIARTGWRTDNLTNAIVNEKLDSNWSMVTLLIGVNNQYQNRPVSDYEVEFEQLLIRAIALAKGRKDKVFVISIPDYAFTPFGKNSSKISTEIDLFNEKNKKITEKYGVNYYDITPISRRGLAEPDLIASDGLHPSSKMYAEWVDLMTK